MIEDLRAQFPVLETGIYLNSNSTGAMPLGVQEVLQRYWQTVSTWRDETWGGWLSEVDDYLALLAEFIGAPTGTIAIDANVSTLMGRLGTCLDFGGDRNRVVTSDLEFPTAEFLWRGFARYGARTVVAGSGGPDFDMDALVSAVDERTRLVCLSHSAYRTGALADLPRLIARAHECGALVAVDTFQSVGVVPVDVGTLDVDFVFGGAHKWMCGAHTAFLYVRQDLLPGLRPAATGWFAGADPLSFGPVQDWASDARRMSSGTPVPLTAMMSRVGLDLLSQIGSDTIRKHSLNCTDLIIRRADEIGVGVLTPRDPEHRGGVVALDLPLHTKELLDERGVICNWRGGLRVAPHIYNTLDEVDRFMDILAEVR